MTALITRLERCAAADERMATLTRDEVRLLLSLWVAANEVAAHPVGTSAPIKRLRAAVRRLTS